jgi:hypothetical protein
MMHGHEKSDHAIVAVKPANKAEPAVEQSTAESAAAEPGEPRAGAKGNADQQSTCRTQSRVSVSQALERIRQLLAVWTRGGSRMRESRTYGFVRGARGNSRPYRVLQFCPARCCTCSGPLLALKRLSALPRLRISGPMSRPPLL